MLKIKEYVKAESLEQAYELNQKKSNCILGGMLWLKMSDRTVQKAIDLSGLGLDTIEETEDSFSIGCMVTLRQLELHPRLNEWTNGAIRDCVKDIVGVQFRNLATIGGSIFGRFGFSDVLTCFLALDTYVELYQSGVIPLEQFVGIKRDRDILVRIIVKKTPVKCVYMTHRNAKTDFPVLACAAALSGQTDNCRGYVVAGARPGRAIRIEIGTEEVMRLRKGAYTKEDLRSLAAGLAKDILMDSNMRASAEYRSHLAEVLLFRCLSTLQERGGEV